MTEEKRGRGRPKLSEEEKARRAQERAAAKSGASSGKVVEAAVWPPEDLDDEQLRVVFLQNVSNVTRADATLEKAKEDRKSAIAKAQSEYGSTFLEHMKLDERLQRDDGKRMFCETMEGAARIARWNNVPIQQDLFAEDRMPVEDRAFEDGKRVGMAGGNPLAPGHYGGPLASKWTEGWHAGQAIARKRLESMQAPPPARDLDEGTEVFDYFAEGAEARRRGEGGTIPEGYSKVQGDEWLRGWGSVVSDPQYAEHESAEAA